MSARPVPSLLRLGVRAAPRRRLYCLPYAGGGVAAYRQWASGLPDDIEVVAAQLPGREARLREAPLTSVQAIVALLADAITASADLPYAIFGHSMGGLVAFELARALEERGPRVPSHLFVSSRRPPDMPDPASPVHALPEPQFLDELQRRYDAIPDVVRQEPELLELLLPVLRADIQTIETYVPTPGAQVRCPVHVYGGLHDRYPVAADLPGWWRSSQGPVRMRLFPGDHFYMNAHRVALLRDIARHWSE